MAVLRDSRPGERRARLPRRGGGGRHERPGALGVRGDAGPGGGPGHPRTTRRGHPRSVRRGQDRIISTSDPEMRHGRKSASRKFDGDKMDVMTDEASELVLGVEIRSGNAGDGEGAAPLLEQVQAVEGIEVETVLGDMAYSDGDTRVAVEELGAELVAKVPPVSNRGCSPGPTSSSTWRLRRPPAPPGTSPPMPARPPTTRGGPPRCSTSPPRSAPPARRRDRGPCGRPTR